MTQEQNRAPNIKSRRRKVSHRKVTLAEFKNDKLFPGVERVVAAILAKGKVVTPVDVLVGMELLKPKQVEDWRFGRIPYLERVTNCNLARLSRILRILRFHVHDLNLCPSMTVYMRWGKGPKQRLRFTKTGDTKLEKAYSTHFIWPGKGPFHPPRPNQQSGMEAADVAGSVIRADD